VWAALRARRRRGLEAAVTGAALLPLVVWVIYGSVDWFWEFPALSGPALGFLGVAAALGARVPESDRDASERDRDVPESDRDAPGRFSTPPAARSRRPVRVATSTVGVVALLAASVVLAFPYLAVRETSIASDLRQTNPTQALHALSLAADLNPLSADPSRLAGTIALASGRYATAGQRFGQTISRDRGGWYGWFGAGLAASALGDRVQARRDFETAGAINPKEPVIQRAVAALDTRHPLSPVAALRLLQASL
jgi:tetratricopeptide (TPR) repeat protein